MTEWGSTKRVAARVDWLYVGTFLAVVAVAGAYALASASCEVGGVSAKRAFQPVPPRVYVAKVKNIVAGLAPTPGEIESVEGDPSRLGALVDAWTALPEHTQKLRRFFELAFQQTQITANGFADQVYGQLGRNRATTPRLLQNVEESFARTVIQLVAEERPLSEAMTTRRIMMTTALKELYAFLDVWQIDNDGNVFDAFRQKNRNLSIVVGASRGPIPIEQTLDPASPNYMVWHNPDVATEETIAHCRLDPVHLRPSAIALHYLLLGTMDGRKLSTGEWCPGFDGTARAPQLLDADFGDWTMVTLRSPAPGEETSTFYDLPALRSARELVLSTPRVGFFSTPAFFANWPTNASNQMRATTNQALIVATGYAIDGTDTTSAPGAPGLDAVHAAEPECVSCHATLDPTRSIFAATWSWNYHNQLDPSLRSRPGVFTFRNVVKPVTSIADFGTVLAEHPLFAQAWVQKLCYYVNSSPCDAKDPEFARIVDLFRSSGHSWRTLFRAFVTSPLTTYAAETETARNGREVVAVARRDHFCAALDARLGLRDACGLETLGRRLAVSTIPEIVSGLPSDSYGRGAVAPILPNEPTPFFVAGIASICESLAARVIDAPPGDSMAKRWSSADPDRAIADFVTEVMALGPSDPRAASAIHVLKEHFAAARGRPGITAAEALQSTFVAACLSPSAVSVGL